jgi:hypothetical protein
MPAVREVGIRIKEEGAVVTPIFATELYEWMGAQDCSIHDVLPLEPFLTVDLLRLGRWDGGFRHDQGSYRRPLAMDVAGGGRSLRSVGKAKRERQRANREAKRDAAGAVPALTDADFDSLLADITVRADCEHASTRSTPDGLVLIRCARNASVGGGCPVDCAAFEARRVGGLGTGT